MEPIKMISQKGISISTLERYKNSLREFQIMAYDIIKEE